MKHTLTSLVLGILLLFGGIGVANALPNFDECGELQKRIKEQTHKLSLDETYYYEKKEIGFALQVDLNKSLKNGNFDKWVLERDFKNRISLASMDPDLYQKYQLDPGTKIIKINEI